MAGQDGKWSCKTLQDEAQRLESIQGYQRTSLTAWSPRRPLMRGREQSSQYREGTFVAEKWKQLAASWNGRERMSEDGQVVDTTIKTDSGALRRHPRWGCYDEE